MKDEENGGGGGGGGSGDGGGETPFEKYSRNSSPRTKIIASKSNLAKRDFPISSPRIIIIATVFLILKSRFRKKVSFKHIKLDRLTTHSTHQIIILFFSSLLLLSSTPRYPPLFPPRSLHTSYIILTYGNYFKFSVDNGEKLIARSIRLRM